MEIRTGQLAGIPVSYSTGPFPDEFVVNGSADTFNFSGFAREINLERLDSERALLKVRVVDVSAERVVLKMKGSFFTTNGTETVSRRWAQEHMRGIAA